MEIIIAIIGSGALSAFISGMFTSINNRKKKEDGVSKALRQLLYNQIKEKGKTYISNGYITAEELEDLTATHSIYHDDLGGNGYLDSLMAAVRGLTLRV